MLSSCRRKNVGRSLQRFDDKDKFFFGYSQLK